jgi:nicotinamidase-related amidase
MSTALLIIDIQNDYFPGGAMECVGATAAGAQAAKLLGAFREQRRPVIHVQHLSIRPGATFFLPGTPGAEIHAAVRPVGDTALLEHLRLRKISGLVVAGMMTHMCVDTTTRAASDMGFACSLAHDATATRALSFNGVQVGAENVQAAYLAGLNGLFAKVRGVNELLTELRP